MSFTDYAAKDSSQKILLAKVEAATRESSFTPDTDTLYFKTFNKSPVISSVEEDGVAYTEASSPALSAGQYYYDAENEKLYVHTIGSDNPNDHFIAVSFFLFFSSRPVSLPHDLGSSFAVQWCPILKANSSFGVALDNKDTNLGNAIEGTGSISFINDLKFWRPIFDKYTFENRRVFVYQYNLGIAPSEARIIYKGLVQTKAYNTEQVTLGLKDLFNAFRNEVPLKSLPDYEYDHRILGTINARITESEINRKQRLVYGRPNGVALQNVDSGTNFPAEGSWSVTTGSTTIVNDNADPDAAAGFFYGGDEIEFSNSPGVTYTVKFIDRTPPNDEMILTEPFLGGTESGVTITITKPVVFRQQLQRYWLAAGHPLSEKTTTVTQSFTGRLFRVDDVSGIEVGDNITVDGMEGRNVTLISPVTKQIEVDLDYTFLPAPGMTVNRSPVRRLFYNGVELEQNVHYTVDADKALIELDSTDANHPEFFLATNDVNGAGELDHSGPGSLKVGAYTDATELSGQIDIGDWILVSGDPVWHQVYQVEDNGDFYLTSSLGLGVSAPDTFIVRKPVYEENPVISADLIGKTLDNTTTGEPLTTGPVIVRDLLVNSGLEDDILSSSFDTASVLMDHTMGLVIPQAISSSSAQVLRNAVNQVNRSIFGSLFQNEDYLLEYSVLDPTRVGSDQRLNRKDIISFSIKSDSRSVVRRVDLKYDQREINPDSLAKSSQIAQYTSDIGQYLVKTEKVKEVDTILISQTSALIFARRWARILELGRTLVTLNTKLQTTERSVNDKVDFTHPNMYERFGSDLTRKIGLVNSIKRSASNVTLTFDDLGNAFSKKSTVTDNNANSFASASEDEIMLNGFITDNEGNVDLDSILTNLIW